LGVYRQPEPLWNPRLRETATTLSASSGQRSGTMKYEIERKTKYKPSERTQKMKNGKRN